MDLNELRAVSRAVLSDELKEQQQPDSKEQSKSEPNSKKQQDEDGITLGESSAESPTCVFLKTHDTKWSVTNGTSIPRRTLPGLGTVVMLKDIWSEDAVQRAIASEERTRAVEADTVPTINALASPIAEKPSGTLLGRVNDSWILLAEEREVADLIASGEYKLFEATEGYSETRANDTSWHILSPDDEKRRLVMHPTSIATSSPRSYSSAATVPCTPKAWREIDPHNDPGPSAPFRPRWPAALRERHWHGGRAAASSRLGAGQSAGLPRTRQSCFEPARPGMTERGREAWLLALREVVQALTESDAAP